MQDEQSPARTPREQFEVDRRRAAFFAFLPTTAIGIIAFDTWVSPWFGIPGGLLLGGVGYVVTYAYETIMWRKEHGS